MYSLDLRGKSVEAFSIREIAKRWKCDSETVRRRLAEVFFRTERGGNSAFVLAVDLASYENSHPGIPICPADKLLEIPERAGGPAKQRSFVTRHGVKQSSIPDRIYFIACEGFVKIGVAHDPLRRLADMQVSNPFPLRLLGQMEGDAVAEQALHAKFAHHWRTGEWFHFRDDLKAFIEALSFMGTEPPHGAP